MPLDIYQSKREKLIQQLKSEGIRDKKVLMAIDSVKRELFVDEDMKRFSYDNNPLPIACNQTISQPYTVAFMTELLEISKGDKVLEVGTGSGYQAAILESLGAEVYSVERIPALYKRTSDLLKKLGSRTTVKCDDGCNGWKENSPFDKIIVTAGSPKVPKELVDQLKVGGIMVIPIGDEFTQEMLVIKKVDNASPKPKLNIEKHKYFRFVPLISDKAWDGNI
jgi:protein-L-isoaspartate(D-aspartate) O-methyltransferase